MNDPIRSDESAALLTKLVDGELTADEHARLSELLRNDEELRRKAVRLMISDALLDELKPAAVAVKASTYRAPTPTTTRQSNWAAPLAIAAIVAVAGAAFGLYYAATEPPVDPAPVGPPVATLIDASGTVLIGDDIANPGREYPASAVSVRTGTADFLLTSGVNVHLRGDSQVTIDSAMGASITHGIGSFRCPPGAVGYTVRLPDGSRVVDLSTAFTVNVDPGGTQTVEVDEGEVMLRYGEAAEMLNAHKAARYEDGAWRFVDLADFGIAATSENVRRLAFAPPSVAAGELEDSDRVFVIRERTGVRLTQPLPVAIRNPGEFTYDRLSSGPLPAGSVVDSYLVHFDSVGNDRDSVASIEASVTFDRPVLGMIVKGGINTHDARFGHPDIAYEQDDTRGIEQEDYVTLSDDRRTVTVRLSGWRPDQVRVFVRSASPPTLAPAEPTAGDPK